jgi:hypothetical protein
METRFAETTRGGSIHYGPFSLVLTKGYVPAQLVHVDVKHPDYQFGLILNNNTPATLVYRSLIPVVRTPEDLMTYLRVSEGGSKIPAAMNQFRHLVQILQDYGICLSTMNPNDYCQQLETDLLQIGTVMSLPGGLLHGGPAYTGYWAVLFWAAHGQTNDIYDINEQYFDGLLLTDILLPLWQFILPEDQYRFSNFFIQ